MASYRGERLQPCLHCHMGSELTVEKFYVAPRLDMKPEDVEVMHFVYCANCGHYGDAYTWNDRILE